MKRYEFLNKVGEEFLQIAKDLDWFMSEARLGPYGQIRYAKISKAGYYRKLYKFEQAGLVKKVRKKYGNAYVLTEKAKRLRQRPSKKINRNDGLFTIIMFDIPEGKHKERDNFRRYLIKNGYTQIQKSVFVSPFRIFHEIKEFAKELNLESHISVIAGKLEQF